MAIASLAGRPSKSSARSRQFSFRTPQRSRALVALGAEAITAHENARRTRPPGVRTCWLRRLYAVGEPLYGAFAQALAQPRPWLRREEDAERRAEEHAAPEPTAALGRAFRAARRLSSRLRGSCAGLRRRATCLLARRLQCIRQRTLHAFRGPLGAQLPAPHHNASQSARAEADARREYAPRHCPAGK